MAIVTHIQTVQDNAGVVMTLQNSQQSGGTQIGEGSNTLSPAMPIPWYNGSVQYLTFTASGAPSPFLYIWQHGSNLYGSLNKAPTSNTGGVVLSGGEGQTMVLTIDSLTATPSLVPAGQ